MAFDDASKCIWKREGGNYIGLFEERESERDREEGYDCQLEHVCKVVLFGNVQTATFVQTKSTFQRHVRTLREILPPS